MGYESKIYIVEKSTIGKDINGKRMWFGDVVAAFRLSKTPIYQEIRDRFSQQTRTSTPMTGTLRS